MEPENFVPMVHRDGYYELNLPTIFFAPARDAEGRPYRMGGGLLTIDNGQLTIDNFNVN